MGLQGHETGRPCASSWGALHLTRETLSVPIHIFFSFSPEPYPNFWFSIALASTLCPHKTYILQFYTELGSSMPRLICVCCIQLACQYHEDGIFIFSVLGIFVQSLLLQLKHYKHLLREFLLANSDNPWLRCPPSMLAPDSLTNWSSPSRQGMWISCCPCVYPKAKMSSTEPTVRKDLSVTVDLTSVHWRSGPHHCLIHNYQWSRRAGPEPVAVA